MKDTLLSKPLPWAGALALSFAAIGCADREHIRDDFGAKARTFFLRQRVHETAAVDSPTGLDSEEASLIQARYRDSLGGGNASTDDSEQVMVLEAPAKQKGK